MLLNVEEGKYIHSTGNINESGKPLENSLSEWLKKVFHLISLYKVDISTG